MSTTRTFSTLNHFILWFGASISIAEIVTGTLLAPLGLMQGLQTILIGHIIGASILMLAGLTGHAAGSRPRRPSAYPSAATVPMFSPSSTWCSCWAGRQS